MCLLSTDGEQVPSTTLIDALLDNEFQLIINDAVYGVKAPGKGKKHISPPPVRSFYLCLNYT